MGHIVAEDRLSNQSELWLQNPFLVLLNCMGYLSCLQDSIIVGRNDWCNRSGQDSSIHHHLLSEDNHNILVNKLSCINTFCEWILVRFLVAKSVFYVLNTLDLSCQSLGVWLGSRHHSLCSVKWSNDSHLIDYCQNKVGKSLLINASYKLYKGKWSNIRQRLW